MKTSKHLCFVCLAALIFVSEASPAEAGSNSIWRTHQNAAARTQTESDRARQARAQRLQDLRDGRSVDVVVRQATEDLNAGKNADVIVKLYARFGYDLNQWALNAPYVSAEKHEAVYLVAIAMLRAEGAVERLPAYKVSTAKRAVDNVRWAIRAMEGLAFVGYAHQRHVAEAWGRDPSLRQAALEKLQLLHSRQKLQSPYQLRLLARLLRESGKERAADGIVLAAAH